MNLWWIGNIILLIVIVPVLVALLNRLLFLPFETDRLAGRNVFFKYSGDLSGSVFGFQHLSLSGQRKLVCGGMAAKRSGSTNTDI